LCAGRYKRGGRHLAGEGEYGSTAFFIVSGSADVFIASPMAHVKTTGPEVGAGFFPATEEYAGLQGATIRATPIEDRLISIDAPVGI